MNFLGSIKLITIGADPEFFVVKNKHPLPSGMFTEDTKESVLKSKERFKIFKDNLLIEGNIPPSKTVEGFVGNMIALKNILNKVAGKRKAVIVSEDAMNFAPRFLLTPDALNFGCSRFFNAWDGMETFYNTIKDYLTPRFENSLRTAGFHIHMGIIYKGTYQEGTRKKNGSLDNPANSPLQKLLQFHINRVITKVFDLLITNPSRHIHVCKERALGYGSFGAFRVTSYGLECRSLGGYFTQDKYLRWIAQQVVEVIKHVNSIMEKDSKALMHFSRHVNLQTTDNIYISPKLYKRFGLDHDKEISKINKIANYNVEKNLSLHTINLSD